MWEIVTYPGQIDPSANWSPSVQSPADITSSITYGEIKIYPGQMDPPLIEQKFTEPYYTKTV